MICNKNDVPMCSCLATDYSSHGQAWKQGSLKAFTHFMKIAIEAPISLYTNMAAIFCFPS